MAARFRATVDPALGVLEYAMKRKDKDFRGALTAAKEVLDRAKPKGEEGLEATTSIVVQYVDPEGGSAFSPERLESCFRDQTITLF